MPLRLLALCLLLLAACEPTKPDPRYELTDDTVRDSATNLTWLRQAGENMSLERAEAYCTERGFRLPTVGELRTLVKKVRVWEALKGKPAIDRVAFPSTPTVNFWALPEPGADPKIKGWIVDFSDGTSHNLIQKFETYRVRCVR
ncbi:MAG: DUF1566 domain-containing protein [Deltaproteobacteria bacterium]|nr:DUF1566 domain-containing protein [Deltaproteobacteria bacterium]